jgi:phospholipid/cholesterol/gamma-HCH transport system substrate-binding protein
MQRDLRSTEIKVGIITLVALLLVFIGISLIKGVSVPGSLKTITARFSNASGLDVGAPVWINGVKHGTVSNVKPDGNTVLVTALVDDVGILKTDAVARVTILELTGGKKLELLPGIASSQWSGEEIKGVYVPDFGELIALVGSIGNDAVMLIRRLDTISMSVNTLLADGKVIKDVKQATSDAAQTLSEVRALVESNKDNLTSAVRNIRTLSEDLNRMIKDNEPQVTSLIKKLDATATTAEKLISSADSTLTNVDKLLTNVDGVVRDIKQGDGLVTKLLYDKKLSQRLDTVMTNLGSFIDTVSKHGVNVNLRLGTRP